MRPGEPHVRSGRGTLSYLAAERSIQQFAKLPAVRCVRIRFARVLDWLSTRVSGLRFPGPPSGLHVVHQLPPARQPQLV